MKIFRRPFPLIAAWLLISGCLAARPAVPGAQHRSTRAAASRATSSINEPRSSSKLRSENEHLGSRVRRIEDLLKGHPGVQVRHSAGGREVRIRGALQEPLFVVDGMPLTPMPGGRTLDLLHIGDVAALDVLTRPEDVAPYGSRASGGVVLIKTKRGRRRR